MAQPITQPDYGSYRWLCRAVARVIGLDTNWHLWDHQQENDVDEIVQRGVMKYYNPPAIDGISGYQWSFLEPVGSITTEANSREYDLPEDFDRFKGPLTYNESESNDYPPIEITSSQRVREMETASDYTRWPAFVSVQPKASEGTTSQRLVAVFHPTPDAVYALSFQYHALTLPLSDSRPWPLGGRTHTEGILASCLAVAQPSDASMALLKERLGSAIAADIKRGPGILGYNGNGRMKNIYNRSSMRDYLYSETVTFNGDLYSG